MWKNDWWKLVEVARANSGQEDLPVWSAMVNYYQVCTVSLVTQQSRVLWNLYQQINGTQNERYETYLQLPAFWVDACRIIMQECNRIDKVKREQTERDNRSRMKRR